MTEIHKNLFVGNKTKYEIKIKNQEGWSVIHACKELYHRQALGYRGKGAPKDHPKMMMFMVLSVLSSINQMGVKK